MKVPGVPPHPPLERGDLEPLPPGLDFVSDSVALDTPTARRAGCSPASGPHYSNRGTDLKKNAAWELSFQAHADSSDKRNESSWRRCLHRAACGHGVTWAVVNAEDGLSRIVY